MSNIKQSLLEHNVIPDVLPDTIDPKYELTIQWPTTTLKTPGQELARDETQSEPKVIISPEPPENLKNLVLIMVDPDLMQDNDPNFGQVRHWLISNTTTHTSTRITIPQLSQQTSPYIGPAPLPNYISPRPHRYVFILAQARDAASATLSADELAAMQGRYTAAVRGKQEGQDLKDRWGFDVRDVVEGKGWVVLGVTFMRVKGNLKAAGANVVMQGEAVVNKVLGR